MTDGLQVKIISVEWRFDFNPPLGALLIQVRTRSGHEYYAEESDFDNINVSEDQVLVLLC